MILLVLLLISFFENNDGKRLIQNGDFEAEQGREMLNIHCVKSVQVQSFFWSVFYRIQSEYGKIQTRKDSVFGHFSHSDCAL